MTFHVLLALAALLAGAVASVVGFGIGSLLTPLLSLRVGTQLAVAAISIPHVFATALRFWRLRAHVDRRVLISLGVTSAAGGLTGALLHSFANNRALSTQPREIAHIWVLILIATLGTLVGTLLGVRALRRMPERVFRNIVATVLFALGAYMTLSGGA